jgi:hypothetical protein
MVFDFLEENKRALLYAWAKNKKWEIIDSGNSSYINVHEKTLVSNKLYSIKNIAKEKGLYWTLFKGKRYVKIDWS